MTIKHSKSAWSWIRRKPVGALVVATRRLQARRVEARLIESNPCVLEPILKYTDAYEQEFAFELKRRGHGYALYTKHLRL